MRRGARRRTSQERGPGEPASPPDGVPLGTYVDGSPAALGIFRPRPVTVTLVGGTWLARLVTLRAVLLGARVEVRTGRPRLWQPLAAALVDTAGPAACTLTGCAAPPAGLPGAARPSAGRPAEPTLTVRDLGARPGHADATGPWCATVTLLPYLAPPEPDPGHIVGQPGPWGDAPHLPQLPGNRLAREDLVGLQRLSPAEARHAASVRGLPRSAAAALPTLPDTSALWCDGARGYGFVRTVPTPTERETLGDARRLD